MIELYPIEHGTCDNSGCDEDGIAYNDDGTFLCEDCFAEWMSEYADTCYLAEYMPDDAEIDNDGVANMTISYTGGDNE